MNSFQDQSGRRKTVLVAAAVMGVLAVYRARGAGESTYKRLWGIGVVFGILALLADFAPSVAAPFAVLVVLGSLTQGGDKALQNLLGSVSSKVPAPKTGG